ncbi:hypothetical protein HAY22_002259 [Salmonella enterica]|nr:hypothetical protein [Salmonella enterica]EEP0978138.1 hypothetical protein [Salmonella enterica]EEP1028169.1 hypothetical protein [Salmonella enterica]EEP1074155.1 hypothetical protein [Salmonella enterica]EEP9129433.1 hypothetical protein [Salmonella enterica]
MAVIVFPAPAGINRAAIDSAGNRMSVPRASGDKPYFTESTLLAAMCSPRQRG